MSPDADLPFRFDVQRMGVLLTLGQGEIERLLGSDRLATLVMKRPILPIDVNVPPCMHMLVSLHGAAFPLPCELLGFVSWQRLI